MLTFWHALMPVQSNVMMSKPSDNYHQPHKSLLDEKEKAVVAEVTESRTIPTTSTTSVTESRQPPSQPPMNTGKEKKSRTPGRT